jgi:hypothetical protein
VAIETYSNNVGFYRQVFYVCPQGGCPEQSPPALTGPGSALALDHVTVSPVHVPLFDKTTVAATLVTGELSLDGVLVFFYDGDPEQGGELFDAELIPHIRANDAYVTRVTFQPRTCGAHSLVVVAQSTAGQAIGMTTVEVQIDPLVGVADLCRLTEGAELPHGVK